MSGRRNNGQWGIKIGMGHALPVHIPLDFQRRLLDWCIESAEGHETACWQWQGHCDVDGYAEVKWRGKKYRAARIAYAAYKGPIIAGTDIDHLCNNRTCINPAHLEQVDPIENRVVRRMSRAQAAPF